MASGEDRVANTVLQECCQDIVDLINVDEVILPLYSKSRLTFQELNRLECIPTVQEKKKQFYIVALANKGSAAFEGILEVLNDTALNYKPHADLADKLSKRHRYLSRRVTQEQAREVRTTTREETTTASLESRVDSDGDDDRLQSLPDVAIEATAQINQPRSRAPLVRQNTLTSHAAAVSGSPIHNPIDHGHEGPATSIFLSLSLGSSSSTRVTQLSSSIQNISDDTMLPSSAKEMITPAIINTGRPVGVSDPEIMNQPEAANLVASTVTKESGFSESLICNEPSVLRKSRIPLPNMTSLKLILLGDSGVGKTSLAHRYLQGPFNHDKLPATIGMKLDQCYCHHIQRGTNIKLSMWDTAGQERFNWVTPNYYHGAHVAVIVFDMTEQKTLLSVADWKTDLLRHLPNDTNIPMLLVGNKCDSPEVNSEIRGHAQQIAERLSFDGFIEASAKNNHKVEWIFEKAVCLALEHYKPPADTPVILESDQSYMHHAQQQQQQQRPRCKKC